MADARRRGGPGQSARRGGALAAVLTYALLSVGAVTMLIPLIWMLSTSLKRPDAVFAIPPEFIPKQQVREMIGGEERDIYTGSDGRRYGLIREYDEANTLVVPANDPAGEVVMPRADLRPLKTVNLVWSNYGEAWSAIKLQNFHLLEVWVGNKALKLGKIENAFVMFYLNSILVAVTVTLGQLITCSLAAYAFARLEFPGREQLFIGYLATMMVPGVVTLIPVFILMRELHLVDTYWALILPGLFSAYGTFLLRQFFMGIPKELEDAAYIDGCGKLGVLRHVILPLSKPALATLATFTFIGSWNDFMGPLIFINSPERKTLPIGLASFQGLYTTEWTLLMAASIIVLLPVLIVFVFNQRFFTEGIQLSGLGGR